MKSTFTARIAENSAKVDCLPQKWILSPRSNAYKQPANSPFRTFIINFRTPLSQYVNRFQNSTAMAKGKNCKFKSDLFTSKLSKMIVSQKSLNWTNLLKMTILLCVPRLILSLNSTKIFWKVIRTSSGILSRNFQAHNSALGYGYQRTWANL